MTFSKEKSIFFDMKKGDSYIFIKDDYKTQKHYTAPFDIVLQKRFSNATILDVYVEDGNRILKFECARSSKYKMDKTILQLEFTGRNTNAIILDENGVILEALRHIDISTSFREIKVGVELKPLPKREFQAKPFEVEDIEEFLKDEFLKREEIKLKALKNQKINALEKKIEKLESALKSIPKEEELERQMQKLYHEANIITANIHKLKNYEKEFRVKDFEGNDIVIKLPKEAKTPSHASKLLFLKAKKLKQKIAHSHIEKENLQNKIEFYKNMQNLVKNVKSSDELNLYFPKQQKQQKRKKQDSNIENFFYKNYKISIGKNQKGNLTLLKEAKMSDIWMHIKDIPSSHVIIRSDKKVLPKDVIAFGAKLCVELSKVNKGNYLVDFTQRRNVKVREGANVNYVNYDTIGVLKE
jgi:predicted ribosome quality control (RQC) complex YloA/Tae2 family protein